MMFKSFYKYCQKLGIASTLLFRVRFFPDLNENVHFHFNQGNPEIKYFNRSNYKGNRGTCTSIHYVCVDFLEEVALGEI